MRRLKKDFKDMDYPEDVRRIIRVAAAHDVFLTPLEAQKAWQDYSDSMCAGWLFLPDDDEAVWNDLPAYVKFADEYEDIAMEDDE